MLGSRKSHTTLDDAFLSFGDPTHYNRAVGELAGLAEIVHERGRLRVDKVNDDMTKWTQEQAKGGDKEAKANEEDTKKMMQVSEDMSKCMQKIITDAAAAGGGGRAA